VSSTSNTCSAVSKRLSVRDRSTVASKLSIAPMVSARDSSRAFVGPPGSTLRLFHAPVNADPSGSSYCSRVAITAIQTPGRKRCAALLHATSGSIQWNAVAETMRSNDRSGASKDSNGVSSNLTVAASTF
jgi:hypothetical protein